MILVSNESCVLSGHGSLYGRQQPFRVDGDDVYAGAPAEATFGSAEGRIV